MRVSKKEYDVWINVYHCTQFEGNNNKEHAILGLWQYLCCIA